MVDLLLHVGPHKTGTTSIQKTLSENFLSLKEKGIFYPRLSDSNEMQHSSLASFVSSNNKVALKAFVEDLNEACYREKFSHVIVSGEEFCTVINTEGWGQFKDHIEKYYNMRIAYVCRDPVERLVSGIMHTFFVNPCELRKHGDDIRCYMEKWLVWDESLKSKWASEGADLISFSDIKGRNITGDFLRTWAGLNIEFPSDSAVNRADDRNREEMFRVFDYVPRLIFSLILGARVDDALVTQKAQEIFPRDAVDIDECLVMRSLEKLKSQIEFIANEELNKARKNSKI